MSAQKKAFLIYLDNAEQVNMLDDASAGKLFKALFLFAQGEEAGFSDGMLRMIYSFMTAQMARDAQKYEETCEKRREWGKMGGRPRKSEKNHKVFKKADTDSVCESETETEIESEIDVESESDTESVAEEERPFPEAQHPARTETTSMKISDVLALTERLGYQWSADEAARFLNYNHKLGRTGDWEFAAEQWERQRPNYAGKRSKSRRTGRRSDSHFSDEDMQDYLALVNRFRE